MSAGFQVSKAFQQKIEELRSKGFKIKTRHLRGVKMFRNGKFIDDSAFECREYWRLKAEINKNGSCDGVVGIEFYPKGGETIVVIETPEGQEYEGSVKCVKKDVFFYREGRERAFWNAWGQLCREKKSSDPAIKIGKWLNDMKEVVCRVASNVG